jgi:hypothetical protein
MRPARLRAAMRRLIATVLAVSALAAAGCGGGDSGSPLDTALSYLPRDAPFAVAIDTDVDGDQYGALRSLLDHFAFGGEIEDRLREQIEQSADGVSYEDDVRPLLGNPFVVGATSAEDITANAGGFVAAVQAADGDALDDLVAKLKARETGEASGATLYESEGSVFAVEDDVVVLAGDRRRLTQALERADGDDHFDEESFEEGLDGLPDEALARVYADVGALLRGDPGSVAARKIKWVAALRTLGLTATARRDSVEIDFRLRTDGDELTEEDLPIAPGEDAPGVIENEGEVGLGIRDLAHIVRFAERSGQAIDPAAYGDYARAKKTIDTQLGVSLDDDLVGQLTRDVSASVALDGRFGVRAELEDPQAFERTLAKVSDVLPSFAQGAGFGRVQLTKPGGGQDFYALTSLNDGGRVFFGVVDDVLVVASDSERAEELGSEQPSPVRGARGSAALGADAEQLANALIEELGSELGIPDLGALGVGLITGPLGELNGYASASTDELRGRLTLSVD